MGPAASAPGPAPDGAIVRAGTGAHLELDCGVVPRAVAATLTVLLHLLILFALLRVTASTVKPPSPPAWHQAVVDRLHEAAERIVSVDIGPGVAARGLACAGSSYVGVGITAELRTERIMLVGDDTPASRAGLRHDDIVLNPEVWRRRASGRHGASGDGPARGQ